MIDPFEWRLALWAAAAVVLYGCESRVDVRDKTGDLSLSYSCSEAMPYASSAEEIRVVMDQARSIISKGVVSEGRSDFMLQLHRAYDAKDVEEMERLVVRWRCTGSGWVPDFPERGSISALFNAPVLTEDYLEGLNSEVVRFFDLHGSEV